MAIEYLNNKIFQAAVERYNKSKTLRKTKKNKIEFEESQTELTKLFYILVKNIIRAFNFQFVDKEDALQEGVWICLEKTHRFDPARGGCFAFFSQISINACRARMRSSKNYNQLKMKYHNHLCDKSSDIHLNSTKSKLNREAYRRFMENGNDEHA